MSRLEEERCELLIGTWNGAGVILPDRLANDFMYKEQKASHCAMDVMLISQWRDR